MSPRQRLAELGRATAQLLEQASLFENDFTIEALAKISGTSEATVSHLVDQAVVAHVLQLSTLKSYRFSHQLLRQALVADLPPSERAAGHRRIAEAMEAAGAGPALLAWHWSASEGPDVRAKVARHARAAGRESVRLLEPGTGAVWFQYALDNLTDEAERGSLLVELAEARQLGGDPRGNEDLQNAVGIALATRDDDLTLQIVRASSPGWYTLPGVTTAESQQVLSRALEIAPDDATRSRILARQAIALGAIDPEGGERLADEAVATARASGERRAVVESLLRRLSVSLSPQSLCAASGDAAGDSRDHQRLDRSEVAILRAELRRGRRGPVGRRGGRAEVDRGGRRHRQLVRPRVRAMEHDGAAGVAGRAHRRLRRGGAADPRRAQRSEVTER